MIVLKTGFNFTLRLLQISEIYCSLIHLHTSIYRKLAFFPLEADSTSLDVAIMKFDALSTPQISRLSFVLRSLLIFLSINIFGVLRVISCVRVDVFSIVPDLLNLDLSSVILQGTDIYHLLGEYFSLQ